MLMKEFIISSFPGVGLNTAKLLLGHFGSIENIVQASAKEMQKIEGVGEKISHRIKDVLEKEYPQKKEIDI